MSKQKSYIKHRLEGDVWHECRQCGEKTWHSHIEYKKVIQVINRSGVRGYGRRRHCCVLRTPKCYLTRYRVCECQNCGKRINLPNQSKKISMKKAKESGIKMVSKRAFRMSMYR